MEKTVNLLLTDLDLELLLLDPLLYFGCLKFVGELGLSFLKFPSKFSFKMF